MSTTTIAGPAWAIEPPKAFYVRQVLASIRQCRVAKHENESYEHCREAHGMIRAGLFLDALTSGEYDSLWDLASNARQCRRQELRLSQQPYTWKPVAAQEDCA